MTVRRETVTIHWLGTGHDGAGWYYVIDEHPEEGSVGSFLYLGVCVAHALESGYSIGAASDGELAASMQVVEMAKDPSAEHYRVLLQKAADFIRHQDGHIAFDLAHEIDEELRK